MVLSGEAGSVDSRSLFAAGVDVAVVDLLLLLFSQGLDAFDCDILANLGWLVERTDTIDD